MKSVLILLWLTKIVFCVFGLANHHGGCFYCIIGNTLNLDCQRFLFFFRFSKGISLATRREKRGWQPKKRKERLRSLFFRASPVSRLTPAVIFELFHVSCVSLDGLRKKRVRWKSTLNPTRNVMTGRVPWFFKQWLKLSMRPYWLIHSNS